MSGKTHAFIDAWPDHCAIVDRRGDIVRVNAAWERFAEANRGATTGRLGVGENYFAVCERAMQGGESIVANVLAGMRGVLAGLAPEFEIEYSCHAPEEPRWFLMRVLPLPGDEGLLVMHRNISRNRRAADERDVAREDAGRAKTAFLATLSHEMRTPLNSIIGFAELLSQAPAPELPGRYREAASHLLASGRLLRAMIDEALDLASIESGRMRLYIEDVALDPLLREVQIISMPLAAKHGIALRADLNSSAVVRADALRLKQVLLNLLSNAIKYNRPGGLVLLSFSSQGGGIRIQVADTGPGIALEQQELLFTPFERLGREHSNIEGTGIGLSICKRLTEAMQGEIGFSSVVGNGSRFWVDIPRSERPDQEG